MYDKDTSQPAESWGKFAGRMYFPDSRTYDDCPAKLRKEVKDSIWLYIAISALYLLLIAVILTVLLLAPKYRITSSISQNEIPLKESNINATANINTNGEIIIAQQSLQGVAHPALKNSVTNFNFGVGNAREDVKDYPVIDDHSQEGDVFLASIKDPLYDIDPRSSIHDGDEENWEDAPDSQQ